MTIATPKIAPAAPILRNTRRACRWPVWLTLAAIVALGVILRCHGIATRSLWFDEAFCWRVAQLPVAEVVARSARDNHPPLYFLALKAWMAVFGESSAALRALSVLSGAVAIVGAYLMVRSGVTLERGARLSGERARRCGSSSVQSGAEQPSWHSEFTALLAAAIVALNVFQVRWGWEARMYALGTALAALSSWAMFRALGDPRNPGRTWFLYGALALAFAYTHVYGLFSIAAQGVFIVGYLVFLAVRAPTRDVSFSATKCRGYYAAIRRCFAARKARMATVTFLGIAAGFAPWLPTLGAQRSQVQADFWTGPVSGWDVPNVCYQMLFCAEDAKFRRSAALASALFCGLVLAALMRRPKPIDWYLLVAVTMPVLLSVLISLADTKIFCLRYFLFAGIFFCCAVARMVGRISEPSVRRLAALGLLANALCVCLAFVVAMNFGDRPGARAACDYISSSRRAGEPVVVAVPSFYLPVKYHLADRSDCFVLGRAADVRHYEGSAALDEADFVSADAFGRLGPGRVWAINNHSGPWGSRAAAAPATWRVVKRQNFREAYGVQGVVEVVEYDTSMTPRNGGIRDPSVRAALPPWFSRGG